MTSRSRRRGRRRAAARAETRARAPRLAARATTRRCASGLRLRRDGDRAGADGRIALVRALQAGVAAGPNVRRADEHRRPLPFQVRQLALQGVRSRLDASARRNAARVARADAAAASNAATSLRAICTGCERAWKREGKRTLDGVRRRRLPGAQTDWTYHRPRPSRRRASTSRCRSRRGLRCRAARRHRRRAQSAVPRGQRRAMKGRCLCQKRVDDVAAFARDRANRRCTPIGRRGLVRDAAAHQQRALRCGQAARHRRAVCASALRDGGR